MRSVPSDQSVDYGRRSRQRRTCRSDHSLRYRAGRNIAEIQMYDHDEEALFAMLCRIRFNDVDLADVRAA